MCCRERSSGGFLPSISDRGLSPRCFKSPSGLWHFPPALCAASPEDPLSILHRDACRGRIPPGSSSVPTLGKRYTLAECARPVVSCLCAAAEILPGQRASRGSPLEIGTEPPCPRSRLVTNRLNFRRGAQPPFRRRGSFGSCRTPSRSSRLGVARPVSKREPWRSRAWRWPP